MIGTGLCWTLLLGLTAVIIAFALGSMLGSSAHGGAADALDSVLPPLLMFIGSFPYFWLATVALFFSASNGISSRFAMPTRTGSQSELELGVHPERRAPT